MNFRKNQQVRPASAPEQPAAENGFHVPPVPSQMPQPKRGFSQKKRNWVLCSVLLLVLAAGACGSRQSKQTESTEPVASKQEEKLQQEPAAQTSAEAPKEQTEPEPAAKPQQEQTAATEPEAAAGIRPDVKEAIDSYESFMNEYVSFMIRYEDNADDTAFLMEYLSLMQKLSDWSETMDSLEKEFTDEENMYFLEAQMRVNGLLLTMPD